MGYGAREPNFGGGEATGNPRPCTGWLRPGRPACGAALCSKPSPFPFFVFLSFIVILFFLRFLKSSCVLECGYKNIILFGEPTI